MWGLITLALGIVALIFLAQTLFGPARFDLRRVALWGLAALGLSLLGAEWLPHPVAGMLLGYLGTHAFAPHWRRHAPVLALGALLGVGAGLAGASWVFIPLVIMGALWGLRQLRRPATGGGEGWGTALGAPNTPHGELPAGMRGEAVNPIPQPEAVPVGAPRTPAQARAAAPSAMPAPVMDGLLALQGDERLPAEARAQLVALDLRTRELSDLLRAGGASEALYTARAIREEYAPSAVQAYLRLPRAQANSLPLEGGKTGRDLLYEQLGLLLDGAQELIDQATRSGGQDLLSHGKFLEEKFGRRGKDWEL